MITKGKKVYYMEKKEEKNSNNTGIKKNGVSITEINKLMLKEFLECPDLNKFDPRSRVYFKNGICMGYWFGININRILALKRPECEEIKKQYEKKRRMDKSKRLLYLRKYKYMFFIMKNMDKFNRESNLTFPDGTFVGEWFDDNKNDILSSEDLIDLNIKKQYNEYLAFEDLKKEFLKGDIEKFNVGGYVRFSTGAIMNFWWECYMDKILLSNDDVSEEIKKQYEAYLSLNKENVKVKK